jgi:hypothetical protein
MLLHKEHKESQSYTESFFASYLIRDFEPWTSKPRLLYYEKPATGHRHLATNPILGNERIHFYSADECRL